MNSISSVWLLTTQFLNEKQGGIGTYCDNLIRNLDQKGINTTVFIPFDGVKRKNSFSNCKIIEFSFNPKKVIRDLGYHGTLSHVFYKAVEKELKNSSPPDFIEFQDYHGIGYFLIQMKMAKLPLLTAIPFFCTVHGPDFWVKELNHLKTLNRESAQISYFEYFTLKNVDSIGFPSNYLREILTRDPQLTNLSQKQAVIRNPLPKKVEASQNIQKNHIVFFGKLSIQKGVLIFLDYYQEFKRAFPNTGLRVTLVGPDIYYEEANQLMSLFIRDKYDLPELIITGNIGECELRKTLCSAQIVVIPSRGENFPYALLETIRLGRIVLCSDEGGQSEIISDQFNGFLFDINSYKDFSYKLNISLNLSENERKVLIENAQNSIEELCDFNTNFKKKVDLIESNQHRKAIVSVNEIQIVTLVCTIGNIDHSSLNSFINVNKHRIESIFVLTNNENGERKIIKEFESKLKFDIQIGQMSKLIKIEKSYLLFYQNATYIDPNFIKQGLRLLNNKSEIKIISSWGSSKRSVHQLASYASVYDLMKFNFVEPPFIIRPNYLSNLSGYLIPEESIRVSINILLLATLQQSEIEIIPMSLFQFKSETLSWSIRPDFLKLIPETRRNEIFEECRKQKGRIEELNNASFYKRLKRRLLSYYIPTSFFNLFFILIFCINS